MRRLVVLTLALFAVLACGRAAYAANVNCASLALYPFPGSPLTNAALSCDSNGNLVVTDQALYNAAYGQTPVPDSGLLLEGWSTLGGGSGVDALVDGPSAGPAGGAGLPLGTPGVLYIQGIGPYGSVPIYSSTGFTITDSTLTYNANVKNGALEVGGVNPSGTPEPFQLDANNYLKTTCATGCSGGPYSAATAQPTQSGSFVGVGGTDGSLFHPLLTTTGGALQVAGTVTGSGTFTMGGSVGTVAQDANNGLTIGGEVQPSAAPTAAAYVPTTNFQNSSGYAVPQVADTSVPVPVATASSPLYATPGATKIVSGVSGKQTFVTGWNIYITSSVTINTAWIYGTSITTPCDNGGTTPGSWTFLFGSYSSSSSRLIGAVMNSSGAIQWTYGGTTGTVFTVPTGDDLCLAYGASGTGAGLYIGGILDYTQH